MKSKKIMNLLLVIAVIMIVVMPLLIIKGSEFGGTDGQAKAMIIETSPGYKPWIESIWAPPGGETESLLFAIQAAIGSGVVCLVIGYYKGRRDGRRQSVSDR